MRTELVIIQSTSLCNVNCRYCYLPYRSTAKRIKLATLSRIFQSLFASPFISDEVTVVWHAGEPLAQPLHFYEQALQLVRRWNTHDVQVTHSMQTNATLLTQQWCDFIKQHDIQIGVSLDGPQPIHDAQRVDWAGKGTFERALRGITLLQTNHIPFSIIAVITKSSLDNPSGLWQFFRQLRPTSLGFNPEEAIGINTISSLVSDEDINRYKEFFKTILTLNASVDDPLLIREAEFLTGHIKHGSPRIRSQTNIAMRILSFDCDGNVSTFSPELLTTTHKTYGNFIFGNVFEGSLEDILANQKFRQVQGEIERGVLNCLHTCDYFMVCGGGFPSNKIYENDAFDSTVTTACRLRVQAATDAMLEHLEEHYDL
jgi:uncharacterized protein